MKKREEKKWNLITKRHKFSKGFLSFLTKLFRKIVLARAIVIIANCKIDYQVLNKIGYEKKTVLIRNGLIKRKIENSFLSYLLEGLKRKKILIISWKLPTM